MRASHLAVLGALGALLVSTGDADAQRKRKKKKKAADIVDVSAVKDKMVVLSDGEGGYFAAVPGDSDHVFYGDGKTMYRQRVSSSFMDDTKSWSMRVWSPRVNHKADLDAKDDGTGTLTCGDDEFELKVVDKAEATKIIDKAQFVGPLWRRQAHALSRDDKGIYYFVDRIRDEYGGKGYRLFAGPKGDVKELPLTNIVSDSQGEIFSTKKGELRFIQERTKATWIKNERRTELVTLVPEDNIPLIYRDLGMYTGSLGTPCDDY